MDFSDPSRVEVVDSDGVDALVASREDWHSRFAASGAERWAREAVMLGPDPTAILDVIDNSDGTVRLIGCVDQRLAESGQQIKVWILTPRKSGGFRVAHDNNQRQVGEPYETQCAEMDLPIANFDPAPEPNLDREAKVVGPAAKSKYTFDSWNVAAGVCMRSRAKSA